MSGLTGILVFVSLSMFMFVVIIAIAVFVILRKCRGNDETRTCHRLGAVFPIVYEVGDETIKGKALNISATGLGIISSFNLEVDSILDLTITFPNNEKVVLKIKVRWTKQCLNGFMSGVKIIPSGNETNYIKFCADMMLQEWS